MREDRLSVHIFGPDSGRPWLWLHGWMGSGREGERVQRVLGNSVKLVCPDLPGHGDTPLSDWDLLSLLRKLGSLGQSCDRALGYSMGGRLLMMAAARCPSAFSTLVIESAHPGLSSLAEKQTRKHLDADRAASLRKQGLAAFCRDWYQAPMWNGLMPVERKGDPEALAGALERFGLWAQPDLRPWLRTTRNSLLWLAGERDEVYVGFAEWMTAHTRHSVKYLNTGHNIHDQEPEGWAEAIHTVTHD